jgi:hypothetical protein
MPYIITEPLHLSFKIYTCVNTVNRVPRPTPVDNFTIFSWKNIKDPSTSRSLEQVLKFENLLFNNLHCVLQERDRKCTVLSVPQLI